MIIEIIKLFEVVVISWALKDLFSFIGGLLYDIKTENKIFRFILLILSYIFSCSDKCAVFWFSFIYSGDLFIAAITSIIINNLSKLENKYTKL